MIKNIPFSNKQHILKYYFVCDEQHHCQIINTVPTYMRNNIHCYDKQQDFVREMKCFRAMSKTISFSNQRINFLMEHYCNKEKQKQTIEALVKYTLVQKLHPCWSF